MLEIELFLLRVIFDNWNRTFLVYGAIERDGIDSFKIKSSIKRREQGGK